MEDFKDSGVVGFVQFADGFWAFSVALNDLTDRRWNVV